MIANRYTGHALADFFHDCAALVTEDRREYTFGVIAGKGECVGVANAGGDIAHQDFARLGPIYVDLFDFKRLARFPCHSST